jgi:hypothetical protein
MVNEALVSYKLNFFKTPASDGSRASKNTRRRGGYTVHQESFTPDQEEELDQKWNQRREFWSDNKLSQIS